MLDDVEDEARQLRNAFVTELGDEESKECNLGEHCSDYNDGFTCCYCGAY